MREKLVPSSWLYEAGRRLDCGPYLSGAMEAKVLLAKLKVRKQPLQRLTKGGPAGIFNGPRFSRAYVLDERYGVPFLGSTDILHADFSFVPLLSRRQVRAQPELVVDESWSLISCSGTVGRMAFSRRNMKGMVGSQHFMRVVADPAEVQAGYLHAYLSSRFGVPLVVGGTYGSIIQHIEPDHLADLPVPRFGDPIERRAHDGVIEAAKLYTEYQAQVRAATAKLFESVGLTDITSGTWHDRNPDLGFARKLDSSTSLRALNFNPRFQQLCDTIRSTSWRPLGELCKPGTLKRGGRYKRIEAAPEYAYQMIGQKEVFWVRPEGRWIAKTCVDADVLVEPGTSLIAGAGTFAESELFCRSEFIWRDAANRAYSELFVRVVADSRKIPSGCLFAFLRSETSFRMLRSIAFGTKLQYPHPQFIQTLPVPYPDERRRAEIHELVIDAYEKRHRAVKLEDDAVALVESAIEGSA